MKVDTSSFAVRLKNDDRSVIDEIYASYHLRLFRFALAYLKNEEDSYDVVQEVFVKLWENRFHLAATTVFDAFLFTVTKNTVISLLRKRITEQKYQAEFAGNNEAENSTIEGDIDYQIINTKYLQLVELLPPKRREIFRLSREGGKSNKEIALEKGISEKTVEDHLTKSLSFLRQQLGKLGYSVLLFVYLFLE